MRHFHFARLLIAGVFSYCTGMAQVAAVKFVVTIPEISGQQNKAVHLVGSFNGWKPNDSFYIMTKEKANTYSLVVPLFEGRNYEYKYTLGDWSSVEINKNDSEIINRRVYSRNEILLYDTVVKWKMPSAQLSPSPQMQKLQMMKDSLSRQLQATLSKMLVLLKSYNKAMLAPTPNERQRKKVNKQTIHIISEFYRTIERTVWALGTALSPEQKKKILAAITSPGPSKDFLTTLGSAYGDAFK